MLVNQAVTLIILHGAMLSMWILCAIFTVGHVLCEDGVWRIAFGAFAVLFALIATVMLTLVI